MALMSTPRTLQELSATDYQEFIPNVPHNICSVYLKDVYVANHNGSYCIPAPKPGERYGSVPVHPGLEKRQLGDGKYLSYLTIPAKKVAEDFIGIPQGETQFVDRGIFVPAGDVPTEEELAAAEEKLRAWAERQVGKADVTWAQTGKITDIADDAKFAAKLLKLTRDWADSWKSKDMAVCPACNEAINKGAKIHAVGQGGCGERIYWNDDGTPYWPSEEKPTKPQGAPTKFTPPPAR